MNISRPVASAIDAVDFSYYTQDDVRRLSVKRITNATALDALLHPTPGGLHDLALGAFLDNPCKTCGLTGPSCPGHCGHIDLPVPVYHCTYIDQMFKYLRSQCNFCHKLKMSRVQVNEYWARLQLLRHGLLEESHKVVDIQVESAKSTAIAADEDSGEDEESSDQSSLMRRRRAFVQECLQNAGIDPKRPVYLGDLSESIAEERKEILKTFHREITAVPRCRNCQAVSPRYRKNKASGVFRKPLSTKEAAHNAQKGIKSGESAVQLLNRMRAKQAERQRRIREGAMDIDEGVADMDSPEEDEIRVLDSAMDLDEPEDISSEEGEDISQEASGSLVAGEASSGTKKKAKAAEEEAKQVFVNASEVYALLTHLFERESEIFAQIYGGASVTSTPQPPSADIFFIKSLVVPPNKYRKEQKSGADEISESPDNANYKTILAGCNELAEIQREISTQKATYAGRVRSYDDLQSAWVRLQDAVNSLIDKEKNAATGLAALRVPDGIKQKLEKKEGLFRMNIMGKRVNFAARSVISPDPNIESNEIGIPPVFAKKLTYPEPVTAHSFEELKQAVLNGPTVWPGAAAVEYENGQVINLRHKNVEERQAIANLLIAPSSTAMTGNRNKKVHRHLNNGDIVIMNRQPTLHKPSMMCHRARVLPGEKTIRMHYANCKTYNADFDGDEMNMHFPQNEIARAEALQIADNDHQYLSATAGEPLRGLIQDHISICVSLTSLDCFFTRDEYHEILYSSLRPEAGHTTSDLIQLLPPTIIKPRPLWTGKQVISTLLANIQPDGRAPLDLTKGCSVQPDQWGKDTEEGQVRIRDGLLLTGIVDKKHIGPSTGGLIHTIYETYGHTTAGKFLSILGRLLTRLLNVKAFSCGMEDLVLTSEGEAFRKAEIKKADTIGLEIATKFVSLSDQKLRASNPELLMRLEEAMRDDSKQAQLDERMSGGAGELTSSITRGCLPNKLIKTFPKNQMQTMVGSGAKGSMVNANLISCNLGQQSLEGRRVPLMISGKSLPTFKPFDSSVRAGGYITDRFLTGVRPQEYYFHAMAGREGLIDTAVKTSRSGYLQRCLIKGLEGLRADYDGSVRDSDGTMVQTLYGEDGLDITKQASLMSFDHLTNNFVSTFNGLNLQDEHAVVADHDLVEKQKSILKDVKRNGLRAQDPLTSQFPPTTSPFSTSERFWSAVREYYDKNKERLKAMSPPISKKLFEKVMAMKYLKSTVEAGEAVGVVAGQSLGEPSTQLTLNTFHLAGHAAKNVTLGVPRLREVLMTASMKMKTPTMTLYHHPELSDVDANIFAKSISRLKLADVLDSTLVRERVGSGRYGSTRFYDIELNFWPSKEYTRDYAITIQDVANALEKKFIPSLEKAYKADLKKRGDEKLLRASDAQPEVGKASRRIQEEEQAPDAENEGGDSDDDDAGDDDATDAKKRKQQDEGQTYEDPEAEEEELARESEEEEDDGKSDPEDEGYGGSPPPSDDDEPDAKRKWKTDTTAEAQERENRVLRHHKSITKFKFTKDGGKCSITLEFPAEAAKLLLLQLVNKVANSALVHHVEGIISAELLTDEKPAHIFVQGANLLAVRDYQNCIDPNRIFTNDVGAMLTTYGVEAARETIIRELRAVFGVHGIAVDQRHMTLVADYMTRKGGYSPFNRLGMQDKTSPFMKMSFETTFGVLRDAVFDGDRDRLDTPSGRITVGKIGRMGTGMCDVLMPVA